MKRSTPYVETHAGWRAFFLCVLIAAVVGCGFRLYFSPARLKSWVTTALDRQRVHMAHPFALSFREASLRLSDSSGWWPQLAVVVSDVRVAPNPDCHPEASVFIGELRLPFRVFDLLSARASVGIVRAQDLVVDLDGLRARCDSAGGAATAAPGVAKASASSVPNDTTHPPAAAKPWWTDEQFDTVRGFVEGVEFSRATLQYENKSKEIYLDSFEAVLTRARNVEIATEIRIPPKVSYGEQIPALKIDGHASSVKADLQIRARVSEGQMQTTATLSPQADTPLRLDAVMSVKSLPLSMLSPLMRKSGLVNAKFEPRFLWLDCEARIGGPFQGLFQRAPLKISDCRIEGDGTDIRLTEAMRQPNAKWEPFDVKVQSLTLAKLFETVGVKGPEGVAANFGKLQGDIHVEGDHVANFKGVLRNLQLLFSNRKIRAVQTVETADVALEIAPEGVAATANHVALAKGVFSGEARLSLNRSLTEGQAHLKIEKLEFDPAVQQVLVNGTLGEIEGGFHAQIAESRIKDFEGHLRVGETKSADFEFSKLDAKATRLQEGPPHVLIEAPSIELKNGFKASFGEAFFHEDPELVLEQPHVELDVLGQGEIDWSKTVATLRRKQIRISSVGSMDRDHMISGHLTVDYPKLKNLVWSVRGPLEKPVLKVESDELKQLKSRAEITEKVLGL